MKRKNSRKYLGIITLLLFLAAFVPTALSPADGTGVSEAAAGKGVRTSGAATASPTAGGMSVTGAGVGTIAVGTAIAEAAVIAVAASQPNSSNPTAIR